MIMTFEFLTHYYFGTVTQEENQKQKYRCSNCQVNKIIEVARIRSSFNNYAPFAWFCSEQCLNFHILKEIK